MNFLATTALPSPIRMIRTFLLVRPEWWLLAPCAAGWWAMLSHGLVHACCGPHRRMSFGEELSYWMLMVAAMMLPLNLGAARLAAYRSLWNRRHRAIAGFLAGYLLPWLFVGIIAASLRTFPWTHNYSAAAALFVVGATWQTSPVYRASLNRCHRRPILSPTGWRADAGALFYGWQTGAPCVVACWPIMLACCLTGHSLTAMVGGFALGLYERRGFRPRTGAMIAGSLLLATWCAVFTFVDAS